MKKETKFETLTGDDFINSQLERKTTIVEEVKLGDKTFHFYRNTKYFMILKIDGYSTEEYLTPKGTTKTRQTWQSRELRLYRNFTDFIQDTALLLATDPPLSADDAPEMKS